MVCCKYHPFCWFIHIPRSSHTLQTPLGSPRCWVPISHFRKVMIFVKKKHQNHLGPRTSTAWPQAQTCPVPTNGKVWSHQRMDQRAVQQVYTHFFRDSSEIVDGWLGLPHEIHRNIIMVSWWSHLFQFELASYRSKSDQWLFTVKIAGISGFPQLPWPDTVAIHPQNWPTEMEKNHHESPGDRRHQVGQVGRLFSCTEPSVWDATSIGLSSPYLFEWPYSLMVNPPFRTHPHRHIVGYH